MRKVTSFFAVLLMVLTVCLPVFAEDGPQPPVVTALEGQIPSDAVVLFDGKNLSEWQSVDGGPAGWDVSGGAMIVKKGAVMTKKEFGDFQLHIEFATPENPVGEGQHRGNSGVYLQGCYELQVLDSYQNETYTDGMCGAIYKQYPPLVNVSRPPGVWQTYDIVFRAGRFNRFGGIVEKAVVTVLHNGVVIQDNVTIDPTPGGVKTEAPEKGPVFLQDHQHPVKYRNIWIRELDSK